MGLDMFAFVVPREDLTNPDALADLKLREDAPKPDQLHYWRKHNALHGWMEQKYRERGGTDPSFNGATLKVDKSLLTDLRKALRNRELKPTGGFFFGTTNYNPGERIEDDLAFIRKAEEAIKAGMVVFYDSWW